MTANLKYSLLFILGMGHSGTTLLGRMLGAHPAALCIGEAMRLEQAVADADERCGCGARFSDCPFWQELLPELPAGVRRDYNEWSAETFERIRVRQGKELLVDTSKSRAFRVMSKCKGRVGFIVMIRDPRGTMRSSLRGGGELSELLKTHLKWIERYLAFARKEPDRCLTIFYEELVARPEPELRRVCEFIGLPFEAGMLMPDAQIQHLVRASKSPYLTGTNRFERDERWREELTDGQINEISRVLRKVPLYRERYQLA